MTDKVGRRWVVTGKVQGVWFRASTKNQAEGLGLSGWARNLEDGSVEVVAFGAQSALSELSEWLKQGPEKAEVKHIHEEDIPWKLYAGFDVL
ncbi:MAG: acylphosphatase [Gammaproteobacteria bacterium]